MTGQVLKQAFWDTYDHLGRLLALNILYALVMLPAVGMLLVFLGQGLVELPLVPRVLIFGGVLFAVLLLGGLLWAGGLLPFASLISAEKDPGLGTFLRGIGRGMASVFGVVLAGAAGVVVCLLNAWFYLFSGLFPEGIRVLGFLLGGLSFWLTALVVAVVVHALVWKVRHGGGTLSVLRVGLLLTLKYPMATFGVLVWMALLVGVGILLKLGGMLVWGFVAPAMLANSLHDVIMERERAAEEAREAADKPKTSWKEIRADENASEEQRQRRARYERGFRDLLRPWEM